MLTITDFETGQEGKAEIVLIAGEHAKELITTEILLWFAYLLTEYNDEELLEWTAVQPVQATAWKSGWAVGTLSEWANKLLQRVVFKVCSDDQHLPKPAKIERLNPHLPAFTIICEVLLSHYAPSCKKR